MILIAAGSNLPFCGVDSQQIVLHSFLALGRISEVVATSPLYTSPAWPDPEDPPFVNAVAQIRTDLPPIQLLAALHAIEMAIGRRRGVPNAARTLDRDLIAYGDIRAERPLLPHPRFMARDFVLAPICDIAPDWRPPGQSETVTEMLAGLSDRSARRLD